MEKKGRENGRSRTNAQGNSKESSPSLTDTEGERVNFSGAPWTEEDDSNLFKLYGEEEELDSIASKLSRSQNACKSRFYKLKKAKADKTHEAYQHRVSNAGKAATAGPSRGHVHTENRSKKRESRPDPIRKTEMPKKSKGKSSNKRWSAEKDRRLMKLPDEELTNLELARRFPRRSIGAIRSRLSVFKGYKAMSRVNEYGDEDSALGEVSNSYNGKDDVSNDGDIKSEREGEEGNASSTPESPNEDVEICQQHRSSNKGNVKVQRGKTQGKNNESHTYTRTELDSIMAASDDEDEAELDVQSEISTQNELNVDKEYEAHSRPSANNETEMVVPFSLMSQIVEFNVKRAQQGANIHNAPESDGRNVQLTASKPTTTRPKKPKSVYQQSENDHYTAAQTKKRPRLTAHDLERLNITPPLKRQKTAEDYVPDRSKLSSHLKGIPSVARHTPSSLEAGQPRRISTPGTHPVPILSSKVKVKHE